MSSIDPNDVAAALDALRRAGGELEDVEVKSGAGGFPTSVRETLVAFANTEGGMVIIGVDEAAGYAVVPIDDLASYRDRLVGIARDAITPPLRVTTDIVGVDGGRVLAVVVPPTPADQRPAYVTAKGVLNGAYLRVGEGDRRMSEGEVALVVASRTQPTYDQEPVKHTTTDDLDWRSLRRSLQRVQASSTKLRGEPDETVLFRMGVTATRDADSPLTLAGLLAFGEFPQQWFPQLMVSVVVLPPVGDTSSRFIDNVTVRGSIPDMVAEALAVIRRNLAARAVQGEFGRVDRLDYPLEAVREALVNALMHRDYSPHTRGTQVQVELHPDRLVIRSPGGLYGGLTTDDLGEDGTSASRNGSLASLLSDTYLPGSEELVAENRASGIPLMIRSARAQGLPRPAFASKPLSFTVTLARSELLSPETRAWISRLGVPTPTPTHEIALAMLHGGPITNAMLREWGADRVTASQVLRDLVDQGVAVKEGGRRYARYVLDRTFVPPLTLPLESAATVRRKTTDEVADSLRILGTATADDVQGLTGYSRPTVVNHLRRLIEAGVAVAEGSRNSPKRRYRWTGPPKEDAPWRTPTR